MKVLFYALVCAIFGAFWLGCADLEYVDDYSDSTFYDDDDEYAEEEAIEKEDNKYAQDAAQEEVMEIASASNKGKSSTESTKESEPSAESEDDEEYIEEEVVEYVDEDEDIEIAEESKPQEQIATQSTPAPQPTPEAKPAPAIIAKEEPKPTPIAKEESKPQPTPQQVSKPTTQEVASKATQETKATQDSAPPIATPSTPKVAITPQAITPKVQKIRGKGTSGLRQSTIKLQVQCDNNANLQKCEDLARIYAVRGNMDNAIIYYERACNSGSGLALSCFFLSQIYANDGNDQLSQYYENMLDERALQNKKVGRTEILLSTGNANIIKRNLRRTCTEGNGDACRFLDNIFKITGEKSEGRTYFGTECWRGSALSCDILRTSY